MALLDRQSRRTGEQWEKHFFQSVRLRSSNEKPGENRERNRLEMMRGFLRTLLQKMENALSATWRILVGAFWLEAFELEASWNIQVESILEHPS